MTYEEASSSIQSDSDEEEECTRRYKNKGEDASLGHLTAKK